MKTARRAACVQKRTLLIFSGHPPAHVTSPEGPPTRRRYHKFLVCQIKSNLFWTELQLAERRKRDKEKIANGMRIALIISLVIASLIACLFIWGRMAHKRELEAIKPYRTYNWLMNMAEGCDKYKAQTGAWPDSLPRLLAARPELKDPWDKDAWGRELIVVPYNASVGYGEIVSYGRDGKPGGDGADRDLEVRFPAENNAAWNTQEGAGLTRAYTPP
jgi:hypothetical protein